MAREIAEVRDFDGVTEMDMETAWAWEKQGVLRYVGPIRIGNTVYHHFHFAGSPPKG